MPYTKREELPEHIREMPEDHQAAWMEAWNAAHAKAKDDGKDDDEAEASAFRVANALMNKMDAIGLVGMHIMSFTVAAISGDDGTPVWNKIAPITDGPRYRVRGIARGSKGQSGEVYEITREMAEEAARNLASVQRGDVPVLLIHPYERQGRGERLGPEDFRRVGRIDQMRISADGAWLEGRYNFTDEGRALVRSGKFDRMSPTVLFAAQDETGENVGCLIFEVSLVPVGEFREQPALAAGSYRPGKGRQGVATMHYMIAGVDCTICCSVCATEVPGMMTMQGMDKATITCGPCPACGKVQAMAGEPGIDSAAFAALQTEMMTLKAERVQDRDTIRGLVTAQAEAAATALVAEGRAAGKIIPATEKYWHDDALENLTRTREKLVASPVIKRYGPQGSSGLPPATDSTTVDDSADSSSEASAKLATIAQKLVSEGKAKDLRTGFTMASKQFPALAAAFSGLPTTE